MGTIRPLSGRGSLDECEGCGCTDCEEYGCILYEEAYDEKTYWGDNGKERS